MPSLNVKVKQSEINKLMRELQGRGKEYEKAVTQVVHKSALNIESGAKQNITTQAVDTSRLRSSIVSELDQSKPSANVHTNVFYAPYVEFGTKRKVRVPAGYSKFAEQFKGSRGGSFQQLLKAIAKWVKRKGIDPKAVFPIALSIAKNGIQARPFLIPAFESERQPLLQRLKKIKP